MTGTAFYKLVVNIFSLMECSLTYKLNVEPFIYSYFDFSDYISYIS